MTLRISQIITLLQEAKEKHGDLPAYTSDSDIKTLKIWPCRDGVERTTDGILEEPNEVVIEVVPCD